MIPVPTSPYAHTIFDLTAWLSGLGFSFVLYRWRLQAALEDVASKVSRGYFVALTGGAVIGAWAAGSTNTFIGSRPVLAHSVVGALVGAIIAVEAYKAARGIKGSTGRLFTGSFAVGVVIGRWGCLFAGLPDQTYGSPTKLPWGVNLGDGVARHPVQVYESAAMAIYLALYLVGLARRSDWAVRRGFYVMCMWYGAQRFAWEFLKPYPKLIGPLNLFHLLCMGLVTYGCYYFLNDAHDQHRAQERALSLPRPDHQPV